MEVSMKKITYTSLLNLTLELYKKSGSLEAYKFITQNAHKVKGNRAQIFNFRYALAAASGLEQEALQIMKEAVLENGFWYAYDYLLEDEDLESLHKYDDFHKMVNLCKEREKKAKKSAKPDLKIIKCNSSYSHDHRPLLIALHGNQENIEITEAYWESIVSENYILALPQSSQIQVSDGYVWDDVEKGANELKLHYENILEKNNIDVDKVIIGGFSAGGRVALNSILNDKISVKGFIFVGPWLPEIDEWEELLNKLKEKGVKGYVICGDKDEDCFECTQKFVSLLEEKNIAHIFKSVKDMDHDYPENFEEILKDAVEYIIKTK
jgi:predicted esterase